MFTAIAASRSDTIFEIARMPVGRMIRPIRSLNANASTTSPRFATSAANVTPTPSVCASRMSVVIDAGPAISGIPSGTTPKSAASFAGSSAAECTRSRAARINRINPPAIWKSLGVIPSAEKIVWPRNKNNSATAPPVHVACVAIFFLVASGTPAPIARKMAANPIGSIATKSGIKAFRKLSNSGGMAGVSRPPAPCASLRRRAAPFRAGSGGPGWAVRSARGSAGHASRSTPPSAERRPTPRRCWQKSAMHPSAGPAPNSFVCFVHFVVPSPFRP